MRLCWLQDELTTDILSGVVIEIVIRLHSTHNRHMTIHTDDTGIHIVLAHGVGTHGRDNFYLGLSMMGKSHSEACVMSTLARPRGETGNILY